MIGRRSRRAARRRRVAQPASMVAAPDVGDIAITAHVVDDASAVPESTQPVERPAPTLDELRAEFEAQRSEMMAAWQRSLEAFEREVVSARELDAWQQSQNTQALTKALDRVADALDGVGNHLQLDRRERAAQSITVEFLLRELVVAFSNPVPDAPAVLGGTIDPRRREAWPTPDSLTPDSLTPDSLTPDSLTPDSLTVEGPLPSNGSATALPADMAEGTAEAGNTPGSPFATPDSATESPATTNATNSTVTTNATGATSATGTTAGHPVRLAAVGHDAVIDLREPTTESFKVGQAVEVRSRFQNRWCGGFIVAEVIDREAPRRYRLLRRLDREVLPVTFEDTDLRLAAFASREDDGAVAQQEHTAVDVRLHRP